MISFIKKIVRGGGTTSVKTEVREMTPAEEERFDAAMARAGKAFDRMDEAFKSLDEAFEEMRRGEW